MAASNRERSFGTYKISQHGNAKGVTIPKDLDRADFPTDLGEEVELVLTENRHTGSEELKLVPADTQ